MKVRFEPVPPNLTSGIAVVERFEPTLPGVGDKANTIDIRLCEDERGYYPKAAERPAPGG